MVWSGVHNNDAQSILPLKSIVVLSWSAIDAIATSWIGGNCSWAWVWVGNRVMVRAVMMRRIVARVVVKMGDVVLVIMVILWAVIGAG